MEAAGVVEEVASDVSEVRVGDRVCYAGMTSRSAIILLFTFEYEAFCPSLLILHLNLE